MNLLTHIKISRILYDHFEGLMDLDRNAFIYGNIKPDLSGVSMSRAHIAENYREYVCRSSGELMKQAKSTKEFSMELGQICHYLCDFFCRYHKDKEIYSRLTCHFLYELRLQYELWKLAGKDKMDLEIYSRRVRSDISSILFLMQSDYFSGPETPSQDIYYAISTAIWIGESIACFMARHADPVVEKGVGACTLLPMA